MTHILTILKNPKQIIYTRIRMKLVYLFARFYSDRKFLETLFFLRVGYRLDLANPKTFNEKLQWLKLYDRRPEYTKMVDKAEAKEYAAGIIGREHIIPTLAVYTSVEDIDFDILPNQFVLKCTHDSGGVVICRDKSKLDKKWALKKLQKGLKRNYFYRNREWPYKNVCPRIIAERYIEPLPNDKDGQLEHPDLKDYKFFVFNGVVKCFKIDFNRQTDHHANYYDRNGQLLPFGEKAYPPQPEKCLEVPATFTKMIELAEKIAEKHNFVRVDFYDHNGKILFGEITFFPASGMGQFTPNEWDYKLGKWLKLPTEIGQTNY